MYGACTFPVIEICPDVVINRDSADSRSCDASRETIEKIISEVWESGKLKKTEQLKKNIESNYFGVFSNNEGRNPCRRTTLVSCYVNYSNATDNELLYSFGEECLKKHQKTIREKEGILFDRRKFCHLTIDYSGNEDFVDTTSTFGSVFVHELAHKLWKKELNQIEQQEFSVEFQMFYYELRNATTHDKKKKLLKFAGYANPQDNLIDGFYNLLQKAKFYKVDTVFLGRKNNEKFFGTEAYAIMAQLLYTGNIIMPRRLRKFYTAFFSSEELNRMMPE